jgi:hypothetical protein
MAVVVVESVAAVHAEVAVADVEAADGGVPYYCFENPLWAVHQ